MTNWGGSRRPNVCIGAPCWSWRRRAIARVPITQCCSAIWVRSLRKTGRSRRDQAAAAFQRALALAEKYLGTDHPTYAAVLLNYAEFLRASGRKAEAKTLEAQSRSVLLESARRNGLGLTVDVSTLRAK